MAVRFELPADHPHVALVTIDRPERANSLDPPTLRELAAAWRADRGRRRDPLRRADRRGRARLLRRHGHDDDDPARRSGSRAASGSTRRDFEGLRAVATAILAGFDLRHAARVRRERPRARRRLDLLLAAEIRYAVPDATLRARGGGARALSDRPRDGAAAAPDRLGARARAPAHRAADRRRARRGDRPRERASSRASACSRPRSTPPTRSPRTRRSPCARPGAACASSSHLPLADGVPPPGGDRPAAARSDDAREGARAFAREARAGVEGDADL